MNIRVDEKIISKIEINDATGSSRRQNYLTYRFYAMVKRKLNASNDQITKIMGQGPEKIKAPNTQYSDLMQALLARIQQDPTQTQEIEELTQKSI